MRNKKGDTKRNHLMGGVSLLLALVLLLTGIPVVEVHAESRLSGYSEVQDFHDGLARVSVGNRKWGLIDKTGKEIVKPEYDDIEDFSEGVARVGSYGGVSKQWGYIDKAGKKITEQKYTSASDFHEGMAAVGIGGEGVYDNIKYGFIDKTGTEVIKLQYQYASDFSEGMAAVKKNGKWGYIDKTGKEVIPIQFEYDKVSDFSDGLAAVEKYDEVNGRYLVGFINKKGKIVVKPKYSDFKFLDRLVAVEKNGRKWGLINKTGKEIVKPKYVFIGDFSEGLAVAEMETEGDSYIKWGYIDKSGKEVIRPKEYNYFGLESEANFSEGMAWTPSGYINKKGKLVIKADKLKKKYGISWGTGQFSEGIAKISSYGSVYYINKKGKKIAQADAGEDFTGGLALIWKKEKPYYINKSGKTVIKPNYDKANSFSDGLALLYRKRLDASTGAYKEEYCFIDKKGKVVLK